MRMPHAFVISRVAEQCSAVEGQMMPLVEGAQRRAGITADLATRKISSNGFVSVEGKRKLWYITRCHV